jgi:hypothetical protein
LHWGADGSAPDRAPILTDLFARGEAAGGGRSYRFVVIATENTENAEVIQGNVPPLCPVRPFPLIAGLPAHWYQVQAVWRRDALLRVHRPSRCGECFAGAAVRVWPCRVFFVLCVLAAIQSAR